MWGAASRCTVGGVFGWRADASVAEGVAPYRRIMPFLMRTRAESVVLFEQTLNIGDTLRFLRDFRRDHPDAPATFLHVVTAAAVKTLDLHPSLNRFASGGRLYQRDGIWISYSAKQELVEGSPVMVLKRRFDPSADFEGIVGKMRSELVLARSGRRSTTDKELGAILRLPAVGVRALVGLERAVDSLGLLPGAYIRNDPLFASMMIANLGSVGLDAAYHHLYEYGTISLFCTIGRIADDRVTLRFTYDERIEDGLYAAHALQDFKRFVERPETLVAAEVRPAPVAVLG